MSKPVSYCWIYQGAGAFRVLCAASLLFLAAQGQAQTDPPEQTGPVQTNAAETKASPENNAPTSARPPINWFYRYMEDWSVLADPALRTDPFDPIKYIPIGSDPKTYLSLGITTRERFESVSYRLTPVQPDNYLIDRMQLHADLHLGPYIQIFTQAVDARAPGKAVLAPIDQDRLDLEQAFIAANIPVGNDKLKLTFGRIEPEFDMQRFADIQDGPNVRQPFDSAAAYYMHRNWRGVAFYCRPVNTFDQRNSLFSTSSWSYSLSGGRVERRIGEAEKLSLLAAQLRNDNAFYLTAAGHERRNIVDLHYTGRKSGWDWDLEGMAQGGHIEGKTIRAWGLGDMFGYTWISRRWSPRVGGQFDAASGNNHPNSGTLRTFNPLFPDGFYEMLAGYPGYANFVHLRASAMAHPTRKFSALLNEGALWRQTTADAVYLLPAIPVANTAGHGSAYSGSYTQIRFDWAISAHLTGALDVEHFVQSRSLRAAGTHDGNFIALELKFGI